MSVYIVEWCHRPKTYFVSQIMNSSLVLFVRFKITQLSSLSKFVKYLFQPYLLFKEFYIIVEKKSCTFSFVLCILNNTFFPVNILIQKSYT